METYSDRMRREIKEIQERNPKIKPILDKLKRINDMHPFAFDSQLEEEYLKYKKIDEILTT